MATLEQLKQALYNADQAGDFEAASTLAAAIQNMQSTVQGPPNRPGEVTPPKKEYTLGEQIIGGLEADAALFTGMTSGAVGYISGVIEGLGDQALKGQWKPEEILQTAEKGAAKFTYEPKTEAGKEITERVGGMMTNLMAFGPHPEMMTGDVSGAMAGASPIVKAKGAEYLTKAQNVTKPVVEIAKKPFQEKPLKVEDVAALEYKASKGNKKAEEKIIKLSETDPEAIAAADRLGLDLPTDLLMQADETNKIAGLARSQAGSAEETAFRNDITHTATVADEALNQLSKYNNIAEASDDIKLALTTSHDMMKNQEKILYEAFDASLPKETPVVADNLFEVLSNTAKELGGEDKLSPTEKRLFALSKDQSLTYGALLREKQNIGSGTKNTMFPDVNDYQLGKIYDAIKQDQKDAVALNLGDDALKNLDIANSLTVKRKGIENQIIAGFGKKGEGSVASLIKQAIASGSKGDVAPLNKLLSIVPKEMHKDVIATALKELSSSGRAADAGTFDFANYAKMYDGLRRNSPIYKTVIETIGTDKAQMLQDLYTISKKIVEAKQNVLHTGKANQAIIAGLKGNSLMQAVVGKIIGWTTSKVTAGLVSPEFLFKTPQEKLQSIANLLRDPDFKQLIIDASKGKATTEAVNKVMETEAFKQVAKDMPKEEVKEAPKAKPTKEEVKAKVEAKKAEKAEAANKALLKEEHSQVLESISDASLQNMMDLYGQDKTKNSFMNSDWEKLKKLGYLEDKLDMEGNTYQVLSAKGEEALYKERDRRFNEFKKNRDNKPIEQQIKEKEQSVKAIKQRIKNHEANAKDEFATDESIEKYKKALERDRNALAKSEKELAELKKKVIAPENEATTLYKEVKDNKNLDAYKSLMVDEGGAKTKGERNKSHNWFDVPVEDDFGQTVATKRIAGQRDITEAFTADKASIDRFMKGKATVEDLKAIKHDLNTFELNSDLRDEASILRANKSNESVELSDGSIYDPFSKMTYSKKEWQDLMDEAMFSQKKSEVETSIKDNITESVKDLKTRLEGKEQKVEGLIRSYAYGKAKKPSIVYRGVASKDNIINQSSGAASEGFGLYTTLNKDLAKDYGEVMALDGKEATPNNPLAFTDYNQYEIFMQQLMYNVAGYKRASDFGVLNPNEILHIVNPHIDGIQIGKGNKTFWVKFPDINEVRTKQNYDVMFSKSPAEQSRLEEWHKDSAPETKNADGSPKVFYHGTKANFDTFDIEKSNVGNYGTGFYFGENAEAISKHFADKLSSNIMPAYLKANNLFDATKINKPLVEDYLKSINAEGFTPNYEIRPFLFYKSIMSLKGTESFKKFIQSKGYDGIIGQTPAVGKQIVVFSPEQIKSIHNKGTFSESNPNILMSQFKTKNATTKQEAQTIAQNLLGKHYAKHADTFEIVQSVEDLPQNIKDALYSVEAYHGSMKERTKIGADTFFTNKPEYAEQYAGKDTRYYPAKQKSEVYFMTGGQIYPAKIELDNFKTVTKAETKHDPKIEQAIISKAKADGYDGLIIKYEGTPREDYVPFSDNVVKLKFDAEILKSGGKARGIFDPKTGKAYIIADAMKANEVEGVILHELLHKNINNEVKAGKSRAEAIMGSRYESVVKRLDNLYKMGDKQVKDAFQKVTDANTPAQHRIEEVMTYLLENITNESKPLLIKWKDDVIAAIKAFIAKTALQLGMKAETVMSKLNSKDIANILRSEAIKNESMLKNIKR